MLVLLLLMLLMLVVVSVELFLLILRSIAVEDLVVSVTAKLDGISICTKDIDVFRLDSSMCLDSFSLRLARISRPLSRNMARWYSDLRTVCTTVLFFFFLLLYIPLSVLLLYLVLLLFLLLLLLVIKEGEEADKFMVCLAVFVYPDGRRLGEVAVEDASVSMVASSIKLLISVFVFSWM